MKKFLTLLLCLFTFCCASEGFAETAAFDLAGPSIELRVQRNGKELPIAQVPNLQPGDRLWIHPNFPESQSERYLIIVAFLRGVTNPPPEDWFTRVESWTKPVRQEGVMVTVPKEAEQALIFLAPETGGDFSTLRSAVRGKPGAFVRAAQDLVQASLDRARLEKYLNAVRETSTYDPKELQERTTLLARSLNIKVDQQCFDKPPDQQETCLTHNTDQMVLDDAHSQSMVAALASGASADLLTQISNTPHAGGGSYSPYVGAVVDLARILSSAHTAKYQYIPALALPEGGTLKLKLNNPPSFRNPKSVIVVGLPPIGPSPAPPLRASDAKQMYCAQKPALVLPAEGAPLVFGTEMAHNLTLRIADQSNNIAELPVTADPTQGGFVVNTSSLKSDSIGENVAAKIKGSWGFDSFEGPSYQLRDSRSTKWVIASSDASALIVGRQDSLHLQSDEAVCVKDVHVKDARGKSVATEWKATKPDTLEVKLALEGAEPGALSMELSRFGAATPDEVALHSYSEAGHLSDFSIHAGDDTGTLHGTRLDEVAGLEIDGIQFAGGELTRANQHDELKLKAAAGADISKLQAGGEQHKALVRLKDGRELEVVAFVKAPRPQVVLISKNVVPASKSNGAAIQPATPDELPQDGQLRFALKSKAPQKLAPAEKIEVATEDESYHVLLSASDGNLTFQDAQTVLATLDPMKHLGPSAFGPLKFRAVSAEGEAGDWQALATLVRTPELTGVRCLAAPEKQCMLEGNKLFLLDSVSTDPQFTNPVLVPEGFVESTLLIPAPAGKQLYLRLRDDPSAVNSVSLPVSGPTGERSGGR